MKIFEYTDESTFDSKQVVVSDEHYNIAKYLHTQYCNDVKAECSPIIVSEDMETLTFCINYGDKNIDKVSYELGDNNYKIMIKPLNLRTSV